MTEIAVIEVIVGSGLHLSVLIIYYTHPASTNKRVVIKAIIVCYDNYELIFS